MLSNNGVNRVFLLGQIITEPTIVNTADGQPSLFFRLLTSETIKRGSENIQHSEYHNVYIPETVVLHEKLTLLTNSLIYIEGRIQTTSEYDAQYIKRYKSHISAYKVELFEGLLAKG